MRSSKSFLIAVALTGLVSAPAIAAHVDFNDQRRALGREDNIRVDAQLGQDTLSANSAITVTYQIENLSKNTVAVADKIADASYDPETQTVTMAIGAEIPPKALPHLATIEAGQKRVFTAGAVLHLFIPQQAERGMAVPRFVQIKVTVLKDLTPFAKLLERAKVTSPTPVPNDAFDKWVDNSSSIFLNTLPIYWGAERPSIGSAEQSSPSE